MSEYEFFVPERVQSMVDALEESTGVRPTLSRYVNGLLMVHENDAVRMTIHWKQQGRKWTNSGSTLTVGGVRQKLLANGYNDYVEIFTTGRRKNMEDLDTVEIPDLDWTLDEDDVPKRIVRDSDTMVHGLRQAHSKERITVTYAREGTGYILRLETPTFILLQRYVTCTKHGFEADRVYQLILVESMKDIYPLLAGTGQQLQDILADLMDNGDPGRPETLGAPKTSSRSNSVEVRRATVIRN